MATTNFQAFSGDVEVVSNLQVGTANLFVDITTGQVGIGKTNPTQLLDIVGNVAANVNTLFVNTVTSRVGIGTSEPSTNFDVNGNVNIGSTLTVSGFRITAAAAAEDDLQAITNAGADTTNQIHITNGTRAISSSTGALRVGDSGAPGGIGVVGNVYVGDTVTTQDLSVNNVISDFAVNTDDFFVDISESKVGVSTTQPHAELHVVGNVYVSSNLTVDADTLHVDAANDRVGVNTKNPEASLHLVGNAYVSSNLTVDADTLHVDAANDRVGVNTKNPEASLHLVGNAYVSGDLETDSDILMSSNVFIKGSGPDSNAVAIGMEAGYTTQGIDSIAIGTEAGKTAQNNNAVAVGHFAGLTAQYTAATAVGVSAGRIDQHGNATAVGNKAGCSSQGAQGTAMGFQAGMNNQGSAGVAIGNTAGCSAQGINAVAIGGSAGCLSQNNEAVAIGIQAGYAGQAFRSIAIGPYTGNQGQGESSIAIGRQAGNQQQGTNSIAIGRTCGYTGQGNISVAIGYNAGHTDQDYQSVAIGYVAGCSNQGPDSVAVGNRAGSISQGSSSVAIGYNVATSGQDSYSIAIGRDAGKTNQGTNSIAIGLNSGETNQPNETFFTGGQFRNDTDGYYLKVQSGGELTRHASDDRIKHNEKFITGAVKSLVKLKPQEYLKRQHLDANVTPQCWRYEAGLMAQEVYYDAPELRHVVSVPREAGDIDNYTPPPSDDPSQDPDYSVWGCVAADVDYMQIVPYLVTAVQEIVTELPRSKTTVSNTWGQNVTGLVVSADTNTHKTNTVPIATLSNVYMDKKWYGVVSDQKTDTNDYDTLVDTKGDTRIWVTDVGGPLESGDLLTTSNIAPGFTQKQSDDLLRSSTVAKVTQDCDFTEPTQHAIRVPKRELSNVLYYRHDASSYTPFRMAENIPDFKKIVEETPMYFKEVDDNDYTEKRFYHGDIEVSEYKYNTLPEDETSFKYFNEISVETYESLSDEDKAAYSLGSHKLYKVIEYSYSKTQLPQHDEEVFIEEMTDVLDENGQIVWEDTANTVPSYTLVDHGTYKAALVTCKLI